MATEDNALTNGSSSEQRPRQDHRCFVCNRTYERVDHLNRHLKSHDNERAYKCSDCGKGFNRADLLNRHRSSHENAGQGERSVRRRTEKACQACIRSKTKCDENRPCKRCKARDVPCVETEQRQEQERRASTARDSNDDTSLMLPSYDGLQVMDQAADTQPDPAIASHEQLAVDAPLLQDPVINVGPSTFDPAFPEFFEHIMMPFEAGDSMVHESIAVPPDVSNLTQDMYFEAADLDFSFLENPASWTPMPFNDIQIDSPNTQQKTDRTPNSEAGSRSEAIKRSPWSWNSWIPPRGVGAFSDMADLNVHQDRVDAADQLTSPGARQVFHCTLDQNNRDQMIRIVTQCTVHKLKMPSFPSLRLLEDLIDVALLEDTYAIDSHIHIPTFKPQKIRTELLLALTARGAAFVSFPPIWKMGMVLQEVVRYAIASEFERDNSTTRELQSVTTSLMWVNTGVWSGFRRSTEIAASFLQPPVTMLAWSNAFSKTRFKPIHPTQDDSTEVLENKWRTWSEQEGWKRLVFHTFLHDSQTMLVHMRAPLIATAQMLLPLPCSRELWQAPNAHAWRSAFLAQESTSSEGPPSLIELFGDPELLGKAQFYTDKSLCQLLIAHSLAHEVFEYRQQAQILRHSGKKRRRDRGLSHMSRRRDLYEDLTTFLTHCETDEKTPPEISFVLEFLMMSLHVSLDDVQLFAGRSGEVEARRIYPIVRTWTQDAESRRAVWHAGQVFSHAKRFEKTRLRDFYAVAIYHATLTLWVWGMVTSGTSRQSGLQTPVDSGVVPLSTQQHSLGPPRTQAKVPLNRPEDRATKAFIQVGHGTPGLTRTIRAPNEMPDARSSAAHEKFCSLSESRELMATAADVFKTNYPHTKGGLPPLVANLTSLLDELGNLST